MEGISLLIIIISCVWFFNENNGHWNNEIQTFFLSNEYTFLNGEKSIIIFWFGENINKILNIKVGFCATFTTKHG